MSTAVSDPLATSAETWRERSTPEPAIPPPPPPSWSPPRDGVSRRDRLSSALHRRHLLQ